MSTKKNADKDNDWNTIVLGKFVLSILSWSFSESHNI